ncbi:hypothetical protein ZWY2020_037978 [Hordeum vulgare]|nr:hypothetical protein ZWY2020_037978 [Hordeum vulgare]
MGLLSRPEEVPALVRLKVAVGRITRQILLETHWAFAYEMLQRVSHSFALGPKLRNAVCVFYLVQGVRSSYDEGKRTAETLTMDYHRGANLEVRIARIFTTCGPRMCIDDGRVVSNFVAQALRKEPLTVYGDGKQTRSFQYVSYLEPNDVDLLNITSMACHALPLCPLAQTEAERGILPILKRIRAVFDKVGINEEESVVVRITGCPNGCATPYVAEVGFVCDGPNSYQIWLGGTPNQTTLAKTFMNKVKLQDIEKVLEPLFPIGIPCTRKANLSGASRTERLADSVLPSNTIAV